MRKSISLAAVLFLAGLITSAIAASSFVVNDPAAGQNLARQLRAMAPEENFSARAMLELERPKSDDRTIPVSTGIVLTNEGWYTVYTAELEQGREVLSILRRAGKPTVYSYATPGRNAVVIEGDRATNSFATSDFSLLDLGLEFFYWPTQVLAAREMKKGRGCYVLESRPASPGLYSRVVSWIDQESVENGAPGLLMAEAYDAAGRLLKQFEVRHFKKVAGQWQVEEMELRNRQTKGSTRLRFDFPSK